MGWLENLSDWYKGDTEKHRAWQAAREAKHKAQVDAYSEYMKTDAYKAEIAAFVEKEKREKEEQIAKLARGEHIWNRQNGGVGAAAVSFLVTTPVATGLLKVLYSINKLLWGACYLLGFIVVA